MRVLAGFGDGAASRDALALAKALRDETSCELVVASPSEEGGRIEDRVAAEAADLVVLGPGERVRDGTGCAVAVARAGLADSGFHLGRIAVAYDGSKEAGAALDLAASLAERAAASLLILGVVEANDGPASRRAEEERMRRHLQRARERVPDGVEAEVLLRDGHVGDLLVEAGREADLLVLGSRARYGPDRRLALGTVSRQVIAAAACSTLVATTV